MKYVLKVLLEGGHEAYAIYDTMAKRSLVIQELLRWHKYPEPITVNKNITVIANKMIGYVIDEYSDV